MALYTIPSSSTPEAGTQPGLISALRRHTRTDTHTRSHTHVQTNTLYSDPGDNFVFLGCGKKMEHLEQTYTVTRRTAKFQSVLVLWMLIFET